MQCPNRMTNCVGLPQKQRGCIKKTKFFSYSLFFCCTFLYLTQRTCQIITVRASCKAVLVLFLV